MTSLHLVVPGQVIASSSSSVGTDGEDSFLKGHGTYLERVTNTSTNEAEQRLVASVVGIVHRVNKLITVIPASSGVYDGQVGDLVVGQVTAVGPTRWKVALCGSGQREAQLPLTGMVLPGGVQRVRTAQDQRDMRQHLQEGDWISAEVHKINPNDGSLLLHTRSMRYGKLSYGTHTCVPPALMPRRKNHYYTDFLDQVDVVWGVNGQIWIQRKLSALQGYHNNVAQAENDRDEDRHERLRQEHASTPLLQDDRMAVARVRNAIECLAMVHAMVTPEHVETVYRQSSHLRPADMLLPDNVIALTACTRQ
ncbi:complex component RRP4 [Seminavis robusta]|uniref:Complex component RRP4 n=1 Tax=Seminavis robusta TaxID=568900 RepID=A0A9N8EEZ9_9STRA|nr:complex component RRP4 [Seminavis robusta]|eukprot:Sro996_g229330.1 complex component RRP4 (308) ;mRNA; r:32332-33255